MSHDALDSVKTNNNSHTIGFWVLVSIVISCELGASIFFLPKSLAGYGLYGIFGWILGGFGAIMIAITFAFMSARSGVTASACSYVRMHFGEKAGFFMNWVYWCAAWCCNPIIIETSIEYLMTVTGPLSPMTQLYVEIVLLVILTAINARGIKTSGRVEVFFTICKLLPLVIVPLFAIKCMSIDNIKAMGGGSGEYTPIKSIIKAALVAFWGFTGLEGCTSTIEFVKNPKKTVPMAIIVGTAFVALISLINTLAIFAVIHPEQLKSIGAPFAHIVMKLFGQSSQTIVGIMTFIMCVGSMNAWILFSGQIARSSVNSNMLPQYFGQLNKYNAPGKSLWISTIGTIVILAIFRLPNVDPNIISNKIDAAVILYLVLYIMIVLAYCKVMYKNKEKSIIHYIITFCAFFFCLIVFNSTTWQDYIFLLSMCVTGIPIYAWMKQEQKNKAS